MVELAPGLYVAKVSNSIFTKIIELKYQRFVEHYGDGLTFPELVEFGRIFGMRESETRKAAQVLHQRGVFDIDAEMRLRRKTSTDTNEMIR